MCHVRRNMLVVSSVQMGVSSASQNILCRMVCVDAKTSIRTCLIMAVCPVHNNVNSAYQQHIVFPVNHTTSYLESGVRASVVTTISCWTSVRMATP